MRYWFGGEGTCLYLRMRLLIALGLMAVSMVSGIRASCSANSCIPEVGNVVRTDVTNSTGSGCNAVLLSNRIILAPAQCLYDVRKRRRHQHLRYKRAGVEVAVTQATLVDPSGGKNLGVGLLQAGTGSVTSELRWSAASLEDLGTSVPRPGSTGSLNCESKTNKNSARYLSSRTHNEPVLFTCPGLPSDSAGLPLYLPGGRSQSPTVFALDTGTCDGRSGLGVAGAPGAGLG